MPTRIVLKETTPPSRLATMQTTGLSEEDDQAIRSHASSPYATPPRAKRTAPLRGSSSQRKVVGFRSSILRDFSSRGTSFLEDEDNVPDEAAEQRRLQLHLSNEDIRASPRLLGYLFSGIGKYCKMD